ncbi:hypothetical protein [Kitasatospora aureofaciens]|uniref:hypothetical protein n=1 Tax=Kitasatospora aureofaciens TaxID=1894 RepID=UPI0005252653|nr:hypothetical protein [Kitasatospora aureofaciens]
MFIGGVVVGLLLAGGAVGGFLLGRGHGGRLQAQSVEAAEARPVRSAPPAEPVWSVVAEARAVRSAPPAKPVAKRLAVEVELEIDGLDEDLGLAAIERSETDADPAELAAFRKAEAALKLAHRIREDASLSDRQQSITSVLRQGRAALEELTARRIERRDAASVIGELREQLAAVLVDPGAATLDPAAAGEYRRARTALDRAAEAARGLEPDRFRRVLAAVGTGRAALLRLEAMLAGRPVPLELITPEELAKAEWEHRPGLTSDRYYYEGRGPAEILVDRPEPGQPTLLDITVEGDDYKHLSLITRTEGTTTAERFFSDPAPYRGRELVAVERTHVRIETEPDHQWSVRFRPLSDARSIEKHLYGQGHEVLICPASGRLRLNAHLRQPGHNGRISFVSDSEVRAGVPLDYTGEPGTMIAHGLGTFRRTEPITGPGLVLVDTPGTWELELRQV